MTEGNKEDSMKTKIELELPIRLVAEIVETAIACHVLDKQFSPDELVELKLRDNLNMYPRVWRLLSTSNTTLRVLMINRTHAESDENYFHRCALAHMELADRMRATELLPDTVSSLMADQYVNVSDWFHAKAETIIQHKKQLARVQEERAQKNQDSKKTTVGAQTNSTYINDLKILTEEI